jgi:cell division protease FtsH
MSDNNQTGPGNGQDGGQGGGGSPWMKSLLIWVGILLGLALFVTVIDGRSTAASGTEVP